MPITYTTTQRSIKQILEWREAGRLRIPLHQRGFVWDIKRQQSLIDTIRRGLPIPSLTLSKDAGGYWIEDGQQRITTLQRYQANKFSYEGFFSELLNSGQLRFLEYKIPVLIYENASMEEKIEIFDRLQNGLALSSGERLYALRHLSPTIMFAISTIFGESDQKLLITQVWGERSLDDGASRMKDGTSRFNTLKQCVCIVSGLLWGPVYYTESYDTLRENLRKPLESSQKQKAVDILTSILEIYKKTSETNAPADTPAKKFREYCWNPRNITGYILWSLWEVQQSEWGNIKEKWMQCLPEYIRDPIILKEKLKDCRKLTGEAKYAGGCRAIFGTASSSIFSKSAPAEIYTDDGYSSQEDTH
jgi:hypothetical protein